MNWLLLFSFVFNTIMAFVVMAWGLIVAVTLARCACSLEEILEVLEKNPTTDGTDSSADLAALRDQKIGSREGAKSAKKEGGGA